MRPRRAREVVETKPEDDRAARTAGPSHAPGDAVDQRDERRVDLLPAARSPAERALRADRAPTAARPHAAAVVVVRQCVEVPARRASEHRHERLLRQLGHLADRPDPAVVQALCGLRSDAPQTLDRERMEEVELAVGWHDEQAVRLGDPARDLGEELRPRHADRDRETDAVAHIPTQARRDLGRRPGDPPHATDVEERLVDRQPLDERRRVLEDLEHRLAGLGVRRHPRGDDDRVGAESTRVPPAHRRSDAVRLGLVARREHDACPDDHGAAAQACVVPLLDRREERVDVGVQDGRLHTNTCSQEDTADARCPGVGQPVAVSR